ncbi:hypothetical protein Lal_00018559 [Lupinus albus]|nr:hypothetical protein Lal_00018559 [Lupinus albus]
MTGDNLYWLSHDQVALFKTFCGTASRCKQTINHAVPRIKLPNSLLYDILLHCNNRSRIHPKIWLPLPILKYPQYWILVPTLVPRKERERKEAENASAEFMEGEREEQPEASNRPSIRRHQKKIIYGLEEVMHGSISQKFGSVMWEWLHARLEASRSFLQGLDQVTWSHGPKAKDKTQWPSK